MDTADTIAQLAETKLLLDAYQDAVLSIVSGKTQEYFLDTGQTIQRVKKIDIVDMTRTINSLMNLCIILELRLHGGGAPIMRPVF